MRGKVAAHHQFFHLRLKTSDVDPEYLVAYLNRPTMQDWIAENRRGAGTGLVVNKSMLGEMPILVPGIDAQRALVELEAASVRARKRLKIQLVEEACRFERALMAWEQEGESSR